MSFLVEPFLLTVDLVVGCGSYRSGDLSGAAPPPLSLCVTLEECKALCRRDPACDSFDWAQAGRYPFSSSRNHFCSIF